MKNSHPNCGRFILALIVVLVSGVLWRSHPVAAAPPADSPSAPAPAAKATENSSRHLSLSYAIRDA